MQKEIGGYLEMEHFTGEEYYPNLYKLNLGRTAFVWLLQNIEHDRVFVPAYICSSVNDSAINAGFNVIPYVIDDNLQPVWVADNEPGDKDILYLVNYYGQLSSDDIKSYRDRYSTIIVDNAQAFFDAPIEGVHTLYSARKFLGVSDGAYVATNLDVDYENLDKDCSGNRMGYLVGRLEKSGRDYYKDMLSASDSFSVEAPKQMSAFTQNMLRGIDYEFVIRRRCENYRILSELLPSDNPFTKKMPTCPFAYPYYHEDGVNLRKYLAEKNIFVPTNWSYLLDKMPEGTLEHKWSEDVLPLPIDQRYDESDMKIVADAICKYNALKG